MGAEFLEARRVGVGYVLARVTRDLVHAVDVLGPARDDRHAGRERHRLRIVLAEVEDHCTLAADDPVAAALEEAAGLAVVLPGLAAEGGLALGRSPLRHLAQQRRAYSSAPAVLDDVHVGVRMGPVVRPDEPTADGVTVQPGDQEGQVPSGCELVPQVLGARRRQPKLAARRDVNHFGDVRVGLDARDDKLGCDPFVHVSLLWKWVSAPAV